MMPAMVSGVREGTESLLRGQHRQLVAKLHELLDITRTVGSRSDEAAAAFAHLSTLMEQHMSIEEQVSFPEFEQRAKPRDRAIVRSLRREHRIVEERLAFIRALFEGGGSDIELHNELKELNVLQAAHARCEEWLVYGVHCEVARGHRLTTVA